MPPVPTAAREAPGHPRTPPPIVPRVGPTQLGPGEPPRRMLVVMQEERSGPLLLPKRSAGEEEEAGRKEGLVCLFPERHRNCYMRHYLTSLQLRMLSIPPRPQLQHPCPVAAPLVSCPATCSCFPPSCKSSSGSLNSKSTCTCPPSWKNHVLSPCVDAGASDGPGHPWRCGGQHTVGFQLWGGC